MTSDNRIQRFSNPTIALHWLMAILLVAVYLLIELRELYPKGSDPREAMKAWHFMLGMTVFGWLADAYDPAVSVAGVGVVSVASGLFTFAMLPWCYRYARAESGKQALAATG